MDQTTKSTNINWYPGHMAAAKRMMEENMKLIDVIIELRDARIPFSSGNPDIEKFKKPRLILLNKSDLADSAKTKLWIDYFESKGIRAKAINARNRQSDIVSAINGICREKAEYFAQKGVCRNMRALIAGIPNSGKSTLINSICGTQKAKTGDKAGVTRGKQWIKTGNIDLLDSPGLLWPKLENQKSATFLAFTGALNDEILDFDNIAFNLVKTLNELYPENLKNRYNIELTDDTLTDLENICRKRGFLLRGGDFDYARCARMLLDEFRGGKLGKMTLEVPNGKL